jgi:hypothetical protein
MCVALLGLSVALGGTTWAATSLPARSVGTAQLRQDAVVSSKVLNHSLTGADIKSSSLGTVPSARTAEFATSAKSALTADAAGHATTADSAGIPYTTHPGSLITLPVGAAGQPLTQTVVATLHVPAGNYVLMAKAQIDGFSSAAIVGCDLAAGTDKDTSFVQGGIDNHFSEIISNSLVHTFAAAGTVNLTCSDGLAPASLSQVRLTAVTVGSIVPS